VSHQKLALIDGFLIHTHSQPIIIPLKCIFTSSFLYKKIILHTFARYCLF